jgi:hypothetical protein
VVAAKCQAIARTRSRPKIDGRAQKQSLNFTRPRVSIAGQGGLAAAAAAAISRVGSGNSSAPLSPVALRVGSAIFVVGPPFAPCVFDPGKIQGKTHSGMDLNGRGARQGKDVPNSAATCSGPVRDRGSLTPAGAWP